MSRDSTARRLTRPALALVPPAREPAPQPMALLITREELERMIEASVDAAVATAMAAYAANDPTSSAHLTVKDAAKVLLCSERTVHRRLRQRRLDASQIGSGPVLVTRESVQRLLAQCRR